MKTNHNHRVNSRQRNQTTGRRGVALLYVITAFTVMAGFVSLGVDFARVQTAKTELQRGTDAAARYAAAGLENIIYGVSAASSNAVAAAADNTVDGVPLALDPNKDVLIGIWDTSAHKFTPVSDPATANAVKITAHRCASRGTAIPLLFGAIIGAPSCDISASAIAMLTPGQVFDKNVPATSNPFLAGMPAGSVASLNNPHNNPDYAGTSSTPRASPVYVNGLRLTAGSTLTFDGINGGANNFSSSTYYSADGNTGWMVSNYDGNENGIANMVSAPINSLVGVFLDDNQPNLSSTPSTNLDYSTDSQRDEATIAPALKQIFFIGNGRRDDGEVQNFVIPKNATRFYLATWDGFEWNNNVGSFNATVHQTGSITLVK